MATIPFPAERRANARHLEALAKGLMQLSEHMTQALNGLPLDARLAQIAGDHLPDAGARLEYVMKLTDEAAHKTLELVERSRKLMERMKAATNDIGAMRAGVINPTSHALGRVQDEATWCTEQLRLNLCEMAVAQGYQDVTGQIIRKVVVLTTEVESALAELLKSAGLASGRTVAAGSAELAGPAVPGVNAGVSQKDADDLLTGLGL